MIVPLLALSSPATAESWCAAPLVAHEWGVTVLHPQGGTVERIELPEHFHTQHEGTTSERPVRSLPPDSGERDLPVLHFYTTQPFSERVPIGLEVGFVHGAASAWYPRVSRLIDATQANGIEANALRQTLLVQRAQRKPLVPAPPPQADPTKQLHWDHLLLTPKPVGTPAAAQEPWLDRARALPGALWVNGPAESERFVFYEADTRESPALVIEAGDSGETDHFVLRNTSDWDVFDVVFVHDGRTWTAPRIPAGKTAGFLLRAPYDPAQTRTWLDERWTDPAGAPVSDWTRTCTMMRDPALPADTSVGHRLYAPEIEVLWSAWADRLLEGGRTRLLYRESPAALDAVMPLALYTDMFHDPSLHRLGVVVVEDPPLP